MDDCEVSFRFVKTSRVSVKRLWVMLAMYVLSPWAGLFGPLVLSSLYCGLRALRREDYEVVYESSLQAANSNRAPLLLAGKLRVV